MNNDASPITVSLFTKLNRPNISGDLFDRPRLLEMLNSGLDGAVTLVVGPAGYGKTTLVSSWIANLSTCEEGQEQPFPWTWLSLDEDDSDPNTFFRYFIAALRKIFPNACPKTHNLLNAGIGPSETWLGNTLNNEIESLPERFIIVLDDLHRLHNPAVFDVLSDWLRHWPQPMHLVLLSRYFPPLPLANLRTEGKLMEIRSQDLRFSPVESREYLNKRIADILDESMLSLLLHRMEGWIAGLKLATLSLVRSKNTQGLMTALADGDVYITDYLIDEVLSNQPPDIQMFLMKLSIAEQFCAPLCDALMGTDDLGKSAQAMLDEIETADLFLSRLDNRREWYRFHQIFHDFLQRRLYANVDNEQVKELHLRAAIWYANNNQPDEAIQHALQAGDLDRAVQSMQMAFNTVLNREDDSTLERWLRMLPKEYIQHNPQMLLIRIWENAARSDDYLQVELVSRVEDLLGEDEHLASPDLPLLKGQLATLKGRIAHQTNQHSLALALCHQALTLLPDDWLTFRGLAAANLGMSLHAIGDAAGAEKFFAQQYQTAKDKTDTFALQIQMGLAVNYLQAGRLEDAEGVARVMLRLSQQGKKAYMEGRSHCILGYILYQWNELDQAAGQYAEIYQLRFSSMLVTARHGMIGLAFSYLAQGRQADAKAMLTKLIDLEIESYGQQTTDSSAARAWLMHAQGEVEAAERWARQFEIPPVDQPLLPWTADKHLIQARILILSNRTDNVQQAFQVLDSLNEIAERTNNTRIRVELLALYALAHLALGDAVRARETIIQAVKLARKSGMLRVFLDLGAQMQLLLAQVVGEREVADMVQRILAAFPLPTKLLLERSQLAGMDAGDPRSASHPILYEHLTPRELEMLKFMAESISLQEIAARLSISYATAKRHTHNIYGKFSVHNRWDAVAFAIRNGILPVR